MCDYLWKHSQEAKLFFGNTGVGSDFAEKLFRYIEGQSVSERYGGDSLNAYQKELIGAFWQSGFFSMIRQWLVEEIPLSPEAVADLMLLVAMRGLNVEQH